MAKLTINGYGQLELNNCAFRRDGRVEAQCALDATAFANVPAENGMILVVDKPNHKIKMPAVAAGELYAINYSAEHLYDERHPGLKDFKLEAKDDFLPRMGYLSAGDLFTTNCIELGSYANLAAVVTDLATKAVYGGVHTSGRIALSTAAPTIGPKLRVVKKTTMPDGQDALQFQVTNA